jgi:hypothetical protein
MAERKAVTKQMARRYVTASKTVKGQMLDELCALTGWTRRHARRALTQALQPTAAPAKRSRARTYGPEVLEPLKVVWATLNGPSGKRLAPFMGEIVRVLEHHGELELEEDVRAKLLQMSSATIDRMLDPERAGSRSKADPGPSPVRSFAARSRSGPSPSGTMPAPASARSTSSPTTGEPPSGSSARRSI